VIVGFPGESDQHFEETYHFIKEQKFSDLHVFPYSQRKGTPAAKYRDQVPEAVKEARVAKLIQLADQLQIEYSTKFLGQELEVIPEEINAEGLLEGYSENYIKVAFRGHPDMLGQIVTVRLDEAHADVSKGTFVEQLTFKPQTATVGSESGLIQIDLVEA
jgi:threonylcarbamoyladenosine tRNA methylthiotransferase MtaB